MLSPGSTDLDVVIFGGGAAGLWTLDVLLREGYRVLLLEAHHLGSGQTAASQGIIHGGLKYTLSGLLTSSAKMVREMPMIWRRCLAGEQDPVLSGTRMRAEFCYLWRTQSLKSQFAMIGARAGLVVAPVKLGPEARPEALRGCPGVVARLDEQVIEPDSLVADLADQHRDHILKIDLENGIEFDIAGAGEVKQLRLINPETGDGLDLRPEMVVFTAGAGNAELRRRVGLETGAMQRRPLHMVVARGDLPALNGHCVDGMHTRATITTTRDIADRTVWQIGGQIAEAGVEMEPEALIEHALAELRAVMPEIDLSCAEWSTYRVDRAEGITKGGMRPNDVCIVKEGNTVAAWPTKMVLVPSLADRIRRLLPKPTAPAAKSDGMIHSWPRPQVADPPWEENLPWTTVV